MLQLIYISSAANNPSTAEILNVSRRNNRQDGISGLLYADGRRFLQALEGPPEEVEAAFARIARDPRHRAAVVLSRRTVDRREFGEWDMAERKPGEESKVFLARVEVLIADADPSVQATFGGLVRLRHAA